MVTKATVDTIDTVTQDTGLQRKTRSENTTPTTCDTSSDSGEYEAEAEQIMRE